MAGPKVKTPTIYACLAPATRGKLLSQIEEEMGKIKSEGVVEHEIVTKGQWPLYELLGDIREMVEKLPSCQIKTKDENVGGK